MDCELLAPAGNFETALAAFEAGADAVYCGLTEFSARAFADNFGIAELKNLLRYCRSRRPGPGRPTKRVYVTFNTVIDEDNLENAVEQLSRLGEVRPDALIVQDLGVARICRKHFPGLELHASTQLVAHNLEGVLALRELGFKRVVLARELSLEEVASIAKRCGDTELEVFIHGALCYSVSGLCLFGAMEKGRSGNRGKCPYCCREGRRKEERGKSEDGQPLFYPFSMKDLRLGEDVRKLADAGVASLKIEGRMKSALYVASVTKYYRDILNTEEQSHRGGVTVGDLETVFSRRTTKLYFDGRGGQGPARPTDDGPIDSESLGHLGTEIGVVKRITKDREGLSWLRFHTSRGLEKHDGLQFEAMTDGKHVGMGIVEMRQAISRRPVFEVNAGVDVEVLVTDEVAAALKPGMKIYCSMSNAVKRMFPTPSFRPSDYPGVIALDVEVSLSASCLTSKVSSPFSLEISIPCELSPAKNPEKTYESVKKAFSKLGETDYRLGKLTVDDPERLFAPMSVLNDLRRDLVEKLDEAREQKRRSGLQVALEEDVGSVEADRGPLPRCRRVKVRADQSVPPGEWDEIVVAINAETTLPLPATNRQSPTPNHRLALPVYTAEPDFNKLRTTVKRFLRAGYDKWEASDLATLRMLKQLGVTDVTADWTLYAFNSRALAALSELGVKRFVASPENGRENLQYLAESGYDVEFLVQQSTPLFVSLTRPAVGGVASSGEAASQPLLKDLTVHLRDGLWVTTKPVPRTFDCPDNVSTRLDLSWDPPSPEATEGKSI